MHCCVFLIQQKCIVVYFQCIIMHCGVFQYISNVLLCRHQIQNRRRWQFKETTCQVQIEQLAWTRFPRQIPKALSNYLGRAQSKRTNMEEQGSFELDKYHMVNGEAQYLGQTMLQKNVKVIKLLLDFDSTSSCVALRAADLGLSGQDHCLLMAAVNYITAFKVLFWRQWRRRHCV